MARRKKADFNYFNLLQEDSSSLVILKARCNEEYLKNIKEKITKHEDFGKCYNIEILEDILSEENIEYYLLEPISIQM